MVEVTHYFGSDLTNCKCLAELLLILLRRSDLKGTVETLP